MENAFERKEHRQGFINGFRIFAAFMFVTGFLQLFFGFYCIGLQSPEVVSGTVPYYIGSIISGFSAMVPTLVCVALYYKGTDTEVQKQEKMTVHAIQTTVKFLLYSSPIVVTLVLFSVIITACFGLCVAKCSYSSKIDMNFGMSAYLLALEGFGLFTILGNALLSWKTCAYLRIETLCHRIDAPAEVDTESEVKSDENLSESETDQS
ncbi:uncharacterized protein LOC127846516 [Dreissena polymorpha]|uniref:Uncharacterized protein n=1 Tax=Dreissena polymorpha TaxID=45954 RepID=A0A9D4ECY6_DREPO|nr:uncharacterized protein LOC127846516 [Dreissena polymorpha]KAH3775980.1 hypothetical protein DPMN_177391 [Dreissena polymorpha]